MIDCSWCGDEMKENMLHVCIKPEEAEDRKILDQVISLTQLPSEEYTHGDILNLISDLLARVSA